jgi:hypothetical protein
MLPKKGIGLVCTLLFPGKDNILNLWAIFIIRGVKRSDIPAAAQNKRMSNP